MNALKIFKTKSEIIKSRRQRLDDNDNDKGIIESCFDDQLQHIENKC